MDNTSPIDLLSNVRKTLGVKSFDYNTTNQDLIFNWSKSSSNEEFLSGSHKNGVKYSVQDNHLIIDETPNAQGVFERKSYDKSGKLENSVKMLNKDGKSFYCFETRGKVLLVNEKNFETEIYNNAEDFANNRPQKKLSFYPYYIKEKSNCSSSFDAANEVKNDVINALNQTSMPNCFNKKEIYTYFPNGKSAVEYELSRWNNKDEFLLTLKLYDKADKELVKIYYTGSGKISQIEQNGTKYNYKDGKLDNILKNIQGTDKIIQFFEDGNTIQEVARLGKSEYGYGQFPYEHTKIIFDKNKNLLSYYKCDDKFLNEENIIEYDGIVGKGIQGVGDCFLLAAVNSIRSLSQGNDILSKIVKPDSDGGFTVTFPGAQKLAKDLAQIIVYNGKELNPQNIKITGTYKFTKEDLEALKKDYRRAVGDKDLNLIEAAYERFRREEAQTIFDYFGDDYPYDIKQPNGLELLMGLLHDRVKDNVCFNNIGGDNDDAIYILLGENFKTEKIENTKGTKISRSEYKDITEGNFEESNVNLKQLTKTYEDNHDDTKLKICEALQKIIDDKKDGKKEIAATFSFRFEDDKGHALCIKDVNEDYVIFEDSNRSWLEIKIPIDRFVETVEDISLTTIPFDETNHASYDNVETIVNPKDIKSGLPSYMQENFSQRAVSPVIGGSIIKHVISNIK